MSKSLGNFFTVRDLLDEGIPGEVIRFVFLSTHYRKPMDWTKKKALEAEATLRRWHEMVQNASLAPLDDTILNCVANDLNTPGALSRMHEIAKIGSADLLLSAGRFLGLLSFEEKWWRKKEPDSNFKIKVDELLIARTAAKADRNFLKADLIRSQLKSAGVEVVDESNGVSNAVFTDNLDPDKLF